MKIENDLAILPSHDNRGVREQYLGHRLVSSEGLNLLVAYSQFMYCVPIIPGFSCLYYAV